MDGKVVFDVDAQFRRETSLVVHVSCRRVWLLRFRLWSFSYMTRLAGFLTGLRIVEIIPEVDDGEAA